MTTDSLNDWSTTVGLNVNIAGTNINVGCAPQDVGVFMRTAMAQIAYAVQGSGGTIPATWHIGTLYATTLNGVPVVTTDGTTGKEVVNFSQFNPTVATPGYIKLPGGVTVQWGNGASSSSGPAGITFPVAFSGTPWTIQMTLKDASNSGSQNTCQTTTAYSTTGFNALVVNTASGALQAAGFFWIAVGPT